jgi:23S rRNA pseudouridine2604 synthase
MRINVFISSTGFCSRREADRLIHEGKVTLNDLVALIGADVGEHDIVCVNGSIVGSKPKTVYLAFHKPEGIESTTDQSKPGNIIDFIGYPERIFPIGRLDRNSSGLILLTNDGMIVNQILRSEFEHEKEYFVEVDQVVTDDFVAKMSSGVKIYNPVRHENIITKPCVVVKTGERTFTTILTQGLNLQIRRMVSVLGFKVLKLKRVRIMNIHLGTLPPGKWRLLSENELKFLKNALDEQSKSPIVLEQQEKSI